MRNPKYAMLKGNEVKVSNKDSSENKNLVDHYNSVRLLIHGCMNYNSMSSLYSTPTDLSAFNLKFR